MSEPILRVDGVVKSFGSIVALDRVSIGVERGTIVGVIGPNGSGKTTLFDCISGTLTPDGGSIRFDGADITETPPERTTAAGLIRSFQEPRVFSDLTVEENLISAQSRSTGGSTRVGYYEDVMRSLIKPRRTPELTQQAEGVLSMIELSDKADQNAETLSHGQKKLLQIGMILMPSSSLVMLDEPTAGVNPSLIPKISDILGRIRDEGTTVLFIEHDMDLTMDLAEEIIVLSNGTKLSTGTPSDVQNDERVLAAYLGGE